MKITDILKPVSIQLNVAPPKSKVEAINILADLMEKGGNLSNKEEYVKAVIAREDSGSTGLGDGIATPHAKSSAVREAGLAAMVVPQGMDFAALDGNPSRLFFKHDRFRIFGKPRYASGSGSTSKNSYLIK